MSEVEDEAMKLRVKLKLPRSISMSSVIEEAHKQLLIGARGGAAVKELLSTAPNIEVAIQDFQAAHGIAEAHAQLFMRKRESKRKETPTKFAPVVQLLDLLHVQRSSTYQSLLEEMKKEMLLRIAELPQSELPRVLEQTFPYIEFRELRAIPIAVLARQEDTPELYLRELTENRRILAELPVHVRRKILRVDRRELQLLVEKCTCEYVNEQLEWYLHHPNLKSATTRSLSRKSSSNGVHLTNQSRKRSLDDSNGGSLWDVSSHVPSSADVATSSSSGSGYSVERRPSYFPDDRRRNNPALTKLVELLGDSESLYLSTLEIWRGYVVAATIPGATCNHPKEYVDYVSLLGAMRSDLANLQRDKTTPLLRTDPLHKFIWFLDRAVKNQTLEIAQLHELLGFIGRLRTSDLPPNKKFRKKSGVEEEEESFEVVLGPPPVDELLVVLDKIARIDARLIFAEPVPDDVPKYRDIIKNPMDLSTMRKKAKRGKYKTLDSFVTDFNLMIRNCMTFNPDTTIFYKEGKRIGKRGNEIIEKNAAALRGEPQRIRSKKRRKAGSGPTSEALSMLTSSGIVNIKDFGDVDQSGMIPEGMCDEMLADVALVLSDPPVRQLICDALIKNIVVCWQKKELPTDNLISRALVQLLQIGNPSSVRRMIRKQDFVLRAPQVVTMRVVLPHLLRIMLTFRVYYAFPAGPYDDFTKAEKDIISAKLWDTVLHASSAIRALAKSFTVQCLVDSQIGAASRLLHHLLLAEEEALLRDRVFLHAVAEVLLEQVKAVTANTACTNSRDLMSSYAENGEVMTTLCEQLQALPIWTQIFDSFFVDVLGQRIRAAKEATGSVVQFADGALESVKQEEEQSEASPKKRKRQGVVEGFPTAVFHEKTLVVLSSLYALVEKGSSAAGSEAMITAYLKKTLGVLRINCSSLTEFQALWTSPIFSSCRQLYELMLSKSSLVQTEFFSVLSSDVNANAGQMVERSTQPTTADSKVATIMAVKSDDKIQTGAEAVVVAGNAVNLDAHAEDAKSKAENSFMPEKHLSSSEADGENRLNDAVEAAAANKAYEDLAMTDSEAVYKISTNDSEKEDSAENADTIPEVVKPASSAVGNITVDSTDTPESMSIDAPLKMAITTELDTQSTAAVTLQESTDAFGKIECSSGKNDTTTQDAAKPTLEKDTDVGKESPAIVLEEEQDNVRMP
ncbi:putative bromodomain, cofactor of BRCA1, Bromodomain-like superfamily [Plasmopara halstedii]